MMATVKGDQRECVIMLTQRYAGGSTAEMSSARMRTSGGHHSIIHHGVEMRKIMVIVNGRGVISSTTIKGTTVVIEGTADD